MQPPNPGGSSNPPSRVNPSSGSGQGGERQQLWGPSRSSQLSSSPRPGLVTLFLRKLLLHPRKKNPQFSIVCHPDKELRFSTKQAQALGKQTPSCRAGHRGDRCRSPAGLGCTSQCSSWCQVLSPKAKPSTEDTSTKELNHFHQHSQGTAKICRSATHSFTPKRKLQSLSRTSLTPFPHYSFNSQSNPWSGEPSDCPHCSSEAGDPSGDITWGNATRQCQHPSHQLKHSLL